MPPKAKAEQAHKLQAGLASALAARDVVDGLAAIGLEAASSTPAELAAMQKAEVDKWAPLVKSIGFTADT